MTASKAIPKNICHIVTVGTTPPGVPDDVIQSLSADLRASQPSRVTILATADSEGNAQRLIKSLGLKGTQARVRLLDSAQSLEEAYMATNEEIERLLSDGFRADQIILHYTAGTKVMSAGAVLAAVNNDLQSLRYLYSGGRKERSTPVSTPTSSVLGDKAIRMATTLLQELRFRSARDAMAHLDDSLLTEPQKAARAHLEGMAHAYEDWDRFRATEFLRRFRALEPTLRGIPSLGTFIPAKAQLDALEKIAAAASADAVYPDELLIELLNNALRRLAEGRPDDALIRLHRAAELYAQGILKTDFNIRTDDVDVRKVPPRHRMGFESERRLDDARIKLGLRRSYELLELLGSPVGEAYRTRVRLHEILNLRRHLVLAHGTRPASTTEALEFYHEVSSLFQMRIRDLAKRAAAQQFPWISNATLMAELRKGQPEVGMASRPSGIRKVSEPGGKPRKGR